MKTRSNCKKGGKKTRRSYSVSATKYSQQRIVTMFLQMLNTVKLYHWKTSSYSQHKATDDLYDNLNKNIDSFVEVMLGKTGGRVNLTGQKTLPLLDYTNVEDFKKEVAKYSNTSWMKKYISDLGSFTNKAVNDLNGAILNKNTYTYDEGSSKPFKEIN
jgi:DNA-binding ferritin-like protein